MKLSAGCWLLAALLSGSDANALRHGGERNVALPSTMPWVGDHMLKNAEQQVQVAERAAMSSEAAHKAILVVHEKLAADMAVEASDDAWKEIAHVPGEIDDALKETKKYALEARDAADHMEKVKADMEKIPDEAALFGAAVVEEEVRKAAYAAAESNALEPAETPEERTKRAADTVAAAAEPYHLAILRAQKNVQESLAKSQKAAELINRLAKESQAMAAKASDMQALGETGIIAQQMMLEAHRKMQKSVDLKYWVGKYYKDADTWNNMIGTYQNYETMAVQAASSGFVEKAKPALPPLPAAV